jgi:hypothetical protein
VQRRPTAGETQMNIGNNFELTDLASWLVGVLTVIWGS